MTLLQGFGAVIYFESGNSNTVPLLSLPAHKAGIQAGSLRGTGCRVWNEAAEGPVRTLSFGLGRVGVEAVNRMCFIVMAPAFLEAPHLHANNV